MQFRKPNSATGFASKWTATELHAREAATHLNHKSINAIRVAKRYDATEDRPTLAFIDVRRAMPLYTCVTENRDSFHLTQHCAETPADAMRLHLEAFPYDDGAGPFDQELNWLQQVIDDSAPLSVHPVGHCKGTWLWVEGARHSPQYLTYIVQTDPNAV